MQSSKMQNPAGGPGFARTQQNNFHVNSASAEPLLQRLDSVQKSGNGWRARCPACGGTSRKLAIAESDGRVLVHCFACNDAEAVLAAVGLRWADLHPPRHWPQSKEEQQRARKAIRESGWSAALSVLALEARIVLLAAREIWTTGGLSNAADDERLAVAVRRVGDCASVLTDQENWKPEVQDANAARMRPAQIPHAPRSTSPAHLPAGRTNV